MPPGRYAVDFGAMMPIPMASAELRVRTAIISPMRPHTTAAIATRSVSGCVAGSFPFGPGDRVLHIALLVAGDADGPFHVEVAHQAQTGLLHDST